MNLSVGIGTGIKGDFVLKIIRHALELAWSPFIVLIRILLISNIQYKFHSNKFIANLSCSIFVVSFMCGAVRFHQTEQQPFDFITDFP